MKSFYSLVALLLSLPLFSQLNMNQLGYVDLVGQHSSEASDIWGYVDQSGNEYAIVGLNDGISVVDVTNPSSAVEVFYHPDRNSIWRDIKTWGDYAYVTTEASDSYGLLIIDLSTLPGNTSLTTTYYTGPSGNSWESAHNLYIDENGICYIFGANRDNGGTIMLDLNTNPMAPVEVGTEDNYYTHDGVARGDTLYQAHISDGFFTLHDVSDKSNPIYLGQQTTPGVFAHNLWFSDDGNYVYTTDEISNGYIGEYDISDPSNIVELDRIQSSPGMNVIPHNAHFLDNYIITSYYRDGVVIHDVSNKGNMVEVGNFDTSPQFSGDGFNGCWGVYPWLPSGNIIASDIEKGLYIIGVNYQRGCYLEGQVTDAQTTSPISGAQVAFVNASPLDLTLSTGNYKTGIATAGTYDIIYSHPSYYSDTIFGVTLTNGDTVIQNAQLTPIIPVEVTINVSDWLLSGIDGATVLLENDNFTYSGTTTSGACVLSGVMPGDYSLSVGKWGYHTFCNGLNVPTSDISQTLTLPSGYYDDFRLDLGWTVSGSAPDGVWERADPNGTQSGGSLINPEDDAGGDCGKEAYVTGNFNQGGAGSDDVDIANTILTSPSMDLTSYSSPMIIVDVWWVNAGGTATPNDSLHIYLEGPSDKVLVKTFTRLNSSSSWQTVYIPAFGTVSDLSDVKIIFETADWQQFGGHLVEAGVDVFRVEEAQGINTQNLPNVTVFPNPSSGVFTINTPDQTGTYIIYNVQGKQIQTGTLRDQTKISIPESGIYLLQVTLPSGTETLKLVKE